MSASSREGAKARSSTIRIAAKCRGSSGLTSRVGEGDHTVTRQPGTVSPEARLQRPRVVGSPAARCGGSSDAPSRGAVRVHDTTPGGGGDSADPRIAPSGIYASLIREPEAWPPARSLRVSAWTSGFFPGLSRGDDRMAIVAGAATMAPILHRIPQEGVNP
jgi:hypothetical protein